MQRENVGRGKDSVLTSAVFEPTIIGTQTEDFGNLQR